MAVPNFKELVKALTPGFSADFLKMSECDREFRIAQIMWGRNIDGLRVPLVTDKFTNEVQQRWKSRQSTVSDDVLQTGIAVLKLQQGDSRLERVLQRFFYRKLKLLTKGWLMKRTDTEGYEQYQRTINAIKLKKCNAFILLCGLLVRLTDLTELDLELCTLELLALSVETCPADFCTLSGGNITQTRRDISCNKETSVTLFDRLLRTIGAAVEWPVFQIAQSIADTSFFKTYDDVVMLAKHQQGSISSKQRWNAIVPKIRLLGRKFLHKQKSNTPLKDLFCVCVEWLRTLLSNPTMFEKLDTRSFSKVCDNWHDDPKCLGRAARDTYRRGRSRKEMETITFRLDADSSDASSDEGAGVAHASTSRKPKSAVSAKMSGFRNVSEVAGWVKYKKNYLARRFGVKAAEFNKCGSCGRSDCKFCSFTGLLSDLVDAARHAKASGSKFLASTKTTVHGKTLTLGLPFSVTNEVC